MIRLSSSVLCAFAFLLAPAARAQSPTGPDRATPERRSPKEPFPNLGLLYKNQESAYFNELWILGRYHGHHHWAEGSLGEEDDGWEHRRLRLGFQARLLKNLTVHAQAVSGTDLEPFYNGFTELWTSWKFSEALSLTVGQQKHRFTHDRNVSSRYLNYFERSQLVNMFAADYTPAVTLSGQIGRLSYYTGVFTNATGRDMGRAFTEFNSGYSFLMTLTWDIHGVFPTDSAHLNLSYVGSDATQAATNLNNFDHGVAAALILTKGPASLVTEVTAGLEGQRGNAIGVNFQPGIFLTDRLQLVGRYQLAGSDETNGLTAQRRYERDVGLTTGDLYQAAYVGLNYYLAGHRAKLMTGVEYATLGSEDSWTAFAGVRVFWGPHARGPFPTNTLLPGLWD
jgi:phosphate-selective porin OprO/OprP